MNYNIGKLPESSRELTAALQEYRQSPEGAVAGCIAALDIMAKNPEEGRKAILLLNPETSPSLLRLAESQLVESPWLMGSYFSGTSPENSYAVPEKAVISLSTNPYSGSPEEGSVKFFVSCSGADSPRPVTVKQGENGSWFPSEWSSLITGIKKPVDP